MKLIVLHWLIFLVTCTTHAQSIKPILGADSLPKTTPWNLESLSQTPEFEWSEGKTVRSLYYRSEPFKGKPTRVFAYYASPGTLANDPAKDNNLPGIVLVHGGGGTAFSEWAQLWASRGYAAIAMDLAGCGPKYERMPDGGPGQSDSVKFGEIQAPITDQWTYHAVANVIRAHSLIRSFPEVDSKRTALTGISWGGYLTCIVAGLDNRFKAAVPVYGCGFLHENSVWLKQFEKMSTENKAKWIQLWDPSMYVGSAAMPMLFVNGGKDFAYPPDSFAKTYALVKLPKNIRFTPYLRHGHIFDRPKGIEVFIKHHLGNGVPLARICSVSVKGDCVKATVETKTKLVAAELHYTLDSLSITPAKRKWLKQKATIKQMDIIATLPNEDITVWFLTLEDERNTKVSSQLIFPGNKKNHNKQEEKESTIEAALNFTAYLMAYFGPEEKLFYAYSHDARNWTALNNSKPVFDAKVRLRDPFINRAKGKFHMVHTKGWDHPTIFHWESADLINWRGGPIDVVKPSGKRAWAPEFFYSKNEDLFYVFWASIHEGHNTMHYLTTKDWKGISSENSKVYYDIGIHNIDLTIVEHNGTYYGFHKPGDVDDKMGNRLSKVKSLDPTRDSFAKDGFGKVIFDDEIKPTEGPEVIKLIGQNKWYIYGDPFHSAMQAWETCDFVNFTRITVKTPQGSKHCSMIPITQKELDALLARFPNKKK